MTGQEARRGYAMGAALALGLCLLAAPAPAGQTQGPEPLTMPRLQELALDHNPQIRQAQANRQASLGRVTQQRAGFWPQVGAEASWRASRNERTLVGDPDDRQVLSGLNLHQTIFDYSLWGRSEAAQWEASAFDEQVNTTTNEVLAEVRFAFLTVLGARQLLEVALAQEQDTQAFKVRAERLLANGLAAPLDVARASLDLAEAQRRVIEFRSSLRRLHARLALAVGLEALYALPVGGEVDYRPEVMERPEAELVGLGQKERPEIKRLGYLVKSAEASVQAAYAGHLPTLELGASLGYSGKYGLDEEYHSYGLFLDLPLFTGWRVSGSLVERRALVKAAGQAQELERQVVRREVRDAFQGLQESLAKTKVSQMQLASALENWRLIQGRYNNGLATPLELSEARTQRFNAQAEVARAHYGVLLSLSELDRAVGGGLAPFPGAAPAPAPERPLR